MNGVKAQIRGISMDDGSLVVDEFDEHNNRTGKAFKLLPDGNSFDFFNGLLRQKVQSHQSAKKHSQFDMAEVDAHDTRTF
ncbi:hypothetical protein ABW20_dc0105273 [Dactylellina cionopaga]|nr:hypothetical protein ABW20_dc0105273 [Dactylellina cionopaga]